MFWFLSRSGYWLARLLMATYRFRCDSELADAATPYILATWHQNLFAGILAQHGRQHVVMISRSRHADVLTYACNRFGHRVVRGSSRKGVIDKGGQVAKDEMMCVLAAGMPGAVTVDGPKGPAHEVKPGIIDMARRTQLAIVPYAAIAEHSWSFASWDAFRLPKPFTIIHIRYGLPIHIDAGAVTADYAGLQSALGARISELDPARRAH